MTHLQAGHGDALAVIFDRYQRLVLNTALKILRDVVEAEDVMQSVFLEIFHVAVQFDPARGTLKMWILQYAYHRSMNRRQQLITRQAYQAADLSDVEELLTPAGASPLSCMETRMLIKESLVTLNPVQKRVLELAYFEGLSLKEIAEGTGESLGNVRHHYYRGLARLRTFITEENPAKATAVRKEAASASA